MARILVNIVRVQARPACLPGVHPLFDLCDQNIAYHDLGHPLCEFQDIVPHPVGSLLVGGQRLIRGVEDTDGDEYVRAAIEEIVAVPTENLIRAGTGAAMR